MFGDEDEQGMWNGDCCIVLYLLCKRVILHCMTRHCIMNSCHLSAVLSLHRRRVASAPSRQSAAAASADASTGPRTAAPGQSAPTPVRARAASVTAVTGAYFVYNTNMFLCMIS